ncbi:hypothetical protein [uncultured Tateyamaria sp.]|nr:hypothetical protein [uncultured Tateyamaria sp.]
MKEAINMAIGTVPVVAYATNKRTIMPIATPNVAFGRDFLGISGKFHRS